MYLGRVTEVGETSAIYEAPKHPYTQALLSATPAHSRAERGKLSRRRVLGGEPPSPASPPAGCRFNPRCWLATEECRIKQPALRLVDAREVACHHA